MDGATEIGGRIPCNTEGGNVGLIHFRQRV